MKFKIFISTPFGFEKIAKNEIKLMNIKILKTAKSHLIVEGGFNELTLLNLNLRVASRVFVVLNSFKALSFDDLYEGINESKIEDFLDVNDRFIVNALSIKSKLFSLRSIQSIVKKSMVDRLKKVYKTTLLEENQKEFNFLLRIENDNAYFLIDTSGESLHKRGYRFKTTYAPIRENFAAGLILLSRYFGKGAFIDPLCGSGTFLFEAMLISRNIAPGLFRNFKFEEFKYYDDKIIKNNKNILYSQIKDQEFEIEGYDIDKRSVDIANYNLKNFKFTQSVVVKQRALSDFSSDYKGANVIANFPYGERLLEKEKVEELEKVFNDIILSNDTWKVSILSSNDRYPYTETRRANRIFRFLNAKINTYYYIFNSIARW